MQENFLENINNFFYQKAEDNGYTNNTLAGKTALKELEKLGLPNTKNEEWKYTNIASLYKQGLNFRLAAPSTLEIEDFKSSLYNLDSYDLFFIDGYLLNHELIIAEGANIKVVTNDQYHTSFNNGFEAMNQAFVKNKLTITLPNKCNLTKPIRIIYAATGSYYCNQAVNIVLENGSKATVIEQYLSAQNNLFNTKMEIEIGSNVVLKHYKLQSDLGQAFAVNLTQINQKADSIYSSVVASWSGQMVRNNLHALHLGSNCITNYYGIYMASDKQTIDNHTLVDHAQPHCESNEVYRGIADDFGKAVFNGKIIVRPDAQKTNAYQSNKSILLNDNAHIYSKPQLEIFADDVKCSHGATVGQLDKNELFYLQARGIDTKTAQKLLLTAFLSEVLNFIDQEDIRTDFTSRLEQRLDA